MKFYVTVKQSNIHFITKFGWNIWENDKIMLFQRRQPPFLSVRASCKTEWMWMGSLRRLSGPQVLEICTHWSITSCVPCCKSIINSSRQPMSWKSLCRPFGKRCLENTSTRWWRSSPSAWLPTWLWLAIVVTPNICSNSVCLQVCILISSFQSHQQTTGENNARNAEKWGGGCLGWNSISLSFSNKFQPILVIKCTFDCLTVV